MVAFLKKTWSALLTFAEIIGLREERTSRNEQLLSLFKLRYREFRDLLTANNALLEIIADLEILLRGDKPFGLTALKATRIPTVWWRACASYPRTDTPRSRMLCLPSASV